MTQQYGTVKVDVITYTSGTGGSETDQSITVSSLATISRTGIIVTGDIQAENITANSGLNVGGLADVSGLVVGHDATITGNLVVGSGISASSLIVQANATVSGALGVSGLATVSGITVTETTSLNTLTVTGDTNLEDLAVSGALTVTGNATVSGGLEVSGNAEVEGNLQVSGNTTVTGDVSISGGLVVQGDIDASGVIISGFTGLFASGTVGSPSISFVDDEDTGIYSPAANQVAITTSGTGRLFVDASGKVGIGTDSPATPLQVSRSSTGSVELVRFRIEGQTSNPMLRFFADESQKLLTLATSGSVSGSELGFSTNGNERMRIDASGRLLVGTSSTPVAIESITPKLVSSTSGALNGDVAIYSYRNAGGSGRQTVAPRLFFARSRSNVNGSVGGIVTTKDDIGNIRFAADDGTQFITAAEILAEVDGTPGTNDMPGRLTFSTTAVGSSVPTQRMRIDSDGSVYIGKTTDTSTESGFTLTANGFMRIVRDNVVPLILQRFNSDGSIQIFRRDNTNVGSISVTTTATSYNTSSDYRLKENVVPMTGAADRVKALKPSRFNFIAEPDITVDGFLAHEAQEIVPESVTGEKDGEEMQGIDQSKLVPLLTGALQEALAKIEALEQRLTDAGL